MVEPRFVALYVNCFHGKFIPYGPFLTEAKAWKWIEGQAIHTDSEAFSVVKIERT